MSTINLALQRPGNDAHIDPTGTYRWWLTRCWEPAAAPATFIMLNPSTADALVNDATIIRCIGFAKRWGCGSIIAVNLYAYRATNPAHLASALDPVGPMNDAIVTAAAEYAALRRAPLVAAWGAHAPDQRVRDVTDRLSLAALRHLTSLGTTKAGAPRHPLYVRGDTPPTPWPAPLT